MEAVPCHALAFCLQVQGVMLGLNLKDLSDYELILTMNSRAKDKLIEASSPGPVTKKTYNCNEFYRVETFQC